MEQVRYEDCDLMEVEEKRFEGRCGRNGYVGHEALSSVRGKKSLPY